MQTNGSNGGQIDGDGAPAEGERAVEPPPAKVRDLAEGCVRFVERALGVTLDYQAETLPVLDHWIAEAREKAAEKPETAAVVAHAAGAYFGEVVRRRYPSWWRAEGDDPGAYRVELGPVYLSFSPVQLVADALFHGRGGEDEPVEQLEVDDADREAITARLAELPPVPEDEFFALATRLEVIDIAVDAIRARRLGEGEAEGALRPEDYDQG